MSTLHELHRPLGSTGLRVSPLGLGTVKLGRDQGVKYPNGFTIPDDAQARALEATDYCVATMHMQGFSRMFRPANFAPTEADHEAVKARGEEIFQKGLGVMDKALEGREWLAGSYSFADSALFYVSFWWSARLNKPLPANVAAHYARMNARPAVQRTMKAEGLA